ncbi:hypothetical protein EU805_05365 [Salipiger sp. IMCC34102]|uniref:hypothetical protein n=1 Tax=Salipiger sp. IMCC34102 TaxID=2510647 RepID=UPI00101D05A4|nr:hypothetical protein [Salipiger sp. IMCC34102]RYH03160.1 hypothetical protein EU805_05365 [Salipiger sp. IMCC34102]
MGKRPSGGDIFGQKKGILCALFLGQPLLAEEVRCDLGGVALGFAVDRAQFVDGYAGDPPRRKVSRVRLGDEDFEAEPIVMGTTLGFHGAGRMFLLQDGSGRLTDMTTRAALTGPCEVD